MPVEISMTLIWLKGGKGFARACSMFWFCGQIRKRDWSEQGQLLKARINTKLSVFQATAKLKIKSLGSLDSDGKSSKKLLLSTLLLLVDAAEACLCSVWRKLRICEELFSSLLSGSSQIAITRGGQLLRVLLIHLKPLVLATCSQVHIADYLRASLSI